MRYLDKIGHFMAYQRTIIKAHRSFVGDGWVVCDSCYQRKAAITKRLDWEAIDFHFTMRHSLAEQRHWKDTATVSASIIHPQSVNMLQQPLQSSTRSPSTQQDNPSNCAICSTLGWAIGVGFTLTNIPTPARLVGAPTQQHPVPGE